MPPPETLDAKCITRNILADKPRVTRFPIDWNAAPGEAGAAAAEGGTGEGEMEDDDEMAVAEDNSGEEDAGAAEENAGGEAEVRPTKIRGEIESSFFMRRTRRFKIEVGVSIDVLVALRGTVKRSASSQVAFASSTYRMERCRVGTQHN